MMDNMTSEAKNSDTLAGCSAIFTHSYIPIYIYVSNPIFWQCYKSYFYVNILVY